MHRLYHFFLQIPQENYTGFVIRTGVVVILLSILIIIQAVFSRMKKNRLVMEKKMLQEEFDSQLMQNKIEIQEATFESLGTELHDNVGQLLSTAKMFIGITERNMAEPPLTLVSANQTLDKAIVELRDLSKSLNKEWLRQFDFFRHLLSETARINEAGELNISVKRNTTVLPVTPEEQFAFYRLIQEALQNVIKHAEAKNVWIDISCHEERINGIIRDDGKGFDVKAKHTGLGIKIMKQRIKLLKGKIERRSGKSGTVIDISFPVKKILL